MARLALSGLLGAVCLGQAGPTLAKEGSDVSAAAEVLFQEGVSLSSKGEWRPACAKFAASQELDMAVGTLLRLADCYERVGRLASAWARFREAHSLAQTQGMVERQRIAKERADALEPQLARIIIRVASEEPPGFHVTLGATPVPPASWGSALPVDPGEIVVEAKAPGHLTFSRTVSIPETRGARTVLVLPGLEPDESSGGATKRAATAKIAPKKRTLEPPASSHGGYAARVTGVTFAVAGGTALLSAGGLAALASKRNDESLKHCPQDARLCTTRGVRLRDDALTLADTATVCAAVGGGLLTTGLVVYVLGSHQSSRDRVDLELDPGLAGVSLRARGSF